MAVLSKALDSQQATSVEELRQLEGDRLDALQAAVWAKAVGDKGPSGKQFAVKDFDDAVATDRDMMVHRRCSVARVDLMEKRSRAVALARSGLSYDDIAREVGYASRSGAWHAVHKALDDHQAEEVDSLRALELARLDGLQAGLWPKAAKGEVDAVLAVLRIIDRRARLLGLYPNPVNQGVERGGGSVVNPAFWDHVRVEHDGDWRQCLCHESE